MFVDLIFIERFLFQLLVFHIQILTNFYFFIIYDTFKVLTYLTYICGNRHIYLSKKCSFEKCVAISISIDAKNVCLKTTCKMIKIKFILNKRTLPRYLSWQLKIFYISKFFEMDLEFYLFILISALSI